MKLLQYLIIKILSFYSDFKVFCSIFFLLQDLLKCIRELLRLVLEEDLKYVVVGQVVSLEACFEVKLFGRHVLVLQLLVDLECLFGFSTLCHI